MQRCKGEFNLSLDFYPFYILIKHGDNGYYFHPILSLENDFLQYVVTDWKAAARRQVDNISLRVALSLSSRVLPERSDWLESGRNESR